MSRWRLVADVGGTNVRFARARSGGRIEDVVEHESAAYGRFGDALDAYLANSVDGIDSCCGALIGAAGPVGDDEIRLTNGRWSIRREDISRRLGGCPVRLFNDLQAVALSIPVLEPGDLVTVVAGNADTAKATTRLAVNVGTGFGAATLIAGPRGWMSMASEAGHIALAATTAAEFELCQSPHLHLQSIEDVLSGPGLEHLYSHFCQQAGVAPAVRHSREIFERLDSDTIARRSADMFTVLLARICGDLVLATAAWGGLCLFGSVIQGWHAHADIEAFRRHFAAKGKMSARMATVPVRLVTNHAAPLIGLASQQLA